MDTDFCVAALEEALEKYGKLKVFNIDQGIQFTSDAFTGMVTENGIVISMDGRGRCLDNVFIEGLWCSLKYEEIYLQAHENGIEAGQPTTSSLRDHFRLPRLATAEICGEDLNLMNRQ